MPSRPALGGAGGCALERGNYEREAWSELAPPIVRLALASPEEPRAATSSPKMRMRQPGWRLRSRESTLPPRDSTSKMAATAGGGGGGSAAKKSKMTTKSSGGAAGEAAEPPEGGGDAVLPGFRDADSFAKVRERAAPSPPSPRMQRMGPRARGMLGGVVPSCVSRHLSFLERHVDAPLPSMPCASCTAAGGARAQRCMLGGVVFSGAAWRSNTDPPTRAAPASLLLETETAWP